MLITALGHCVVVVLHGLPYSPVVPRFEQEEAGPLGK